MNRAFRDVLGVDLGAALDELYDEAGVATLTGPALQALKETASGTGSCRSAAPRRPTRSVPHTPCAPRSM